MKTEVTILYHLHPTREIALDLKQKASQCFNLFSKLAKISRISIYNTEEIYQQYLSLENKAAIRQTHILLLILIIFIRNLTNNLLKDILHCNNA
ncbi:hypothetical protein EVA_16144 [gut metagenome]|uniref:Transposase n=1 Tax=gut metagenome TaxID=749906 RepID=J9G8D9_9ZZZZ